jgi:hypothetical protein
MVGLPLRSVDYESDTDHETDHQGRQKNDERDTGAPMPFPENARRAAGAG